MTVDTELSRTLVKSPPELWAELSDPASLARHLNDFGEIRITRLEPETTVAWEGERVRGTVRLEPSGWGTRVILTANAEAGAPVPAVDRAEATPSAPDPVPEVPPRPDRQPLAPDVEPSPSPRSDPALRVARGGLIGRVLSWLRPPVEPEPPTRRAAATPSQEVRPAPVPAAAASPPAPPAPAPEPSGGPAAAPTPGIDTAAVLTAALDSLGQAHHRPFSRG
jgi:hypothetical protein